MSYFAHESAYIDSPCEIGDGTQIWHFCHVMQGARIGDDCVLGQNVHIASGARLGNRIKVQNNVSIYAGITVEDDVFLGPSCVLTNVSNPRAQVSRRALFEPTTIRRGATIGANATVVCGVTVGRYAFVAAGSVVTKDVSDYAFMVGVPARQDGYMSRHGHRLGAPDENGTTTCSESGLRYAEIDGQLRCLDLDEERALPEHLSIGERTYREVGLAGSKRPRA